MADAGDPPVEGPLISHFCSHTFAPPEVAEFYLQAYAWNVDDAIGAFFDDRPPPPLQPNPTPPPPPPPSSPERADAGNKTNAEVEDPIGTFCAWTGKCREEGLFYLEGFRWNLNEAVDGCLKGILPPLGDTLPPDLPPDDEMGLGTSSDDEPPPYLSSDDEMGLGTSSDDDPPPYPKPPKRLRSPLPSLPKLEEGSFTFPKLVALPNFRDQDSSDVVSVISDMLKAVFVPEDASETMTQVEESWKKKIRDYAAPTSESTLEIQLADGTETLVKFSNQDRIRDIHEYINSMRPGDPIDYQLLTKGSPQKELKDMDQTIEEAGIVGSSLIQKCRDSSGSTTGKSILAGTDSPVIGLIEDPSMRDITLTIHLRDGSELELSFAYDKTIRDIHERIDAIRPDDCKAYHFMDAEANPLRDLNQTIAKAALCVPMLVQVDD